ncbi:helix-turn-helix domain-containing protein [Candidatus Galacturonibacter soehngenii]|uniref:Helix-turn-helix transcriptional regulator n=1 Tax=Candidatus Galacturonatibacter soehngenii TaxID=2307010 RepID=A0A7V7UAW1_9FIRM|nr:AraC family transcriptional regulator [Candidatus Galacturonibacter soehngenii]KAB1435712.1 helix-turn-helix transcriptional regulator [Candidatus Galacturonibacter soehngenii]
MKKIKKILVSINNSIFFQTTLILGALCILIVFYLIAFAFRPIIKTEQEKNRLLYENALTSAETIIDYSLLNIHDIITKTSQENCIMSAIVSPDSGSEDSEILLSLSNLKGTSELIQEAFLFIPANDKVYTSKYKLIKRTDFYEKSVIDRYYSSSENLDYISQSGRISKFFIVDSKIFMIRDFPLEGENRLGTFFIKIDVNKFLKMLKINETIYPNHLYVYNSLGTPLFINDANNQSSAQHYYTNIADSTKQTVALDNQLLLHTHSDLTHFKYLLVVNDSSKNNTFMLVLLICPVILLCLVMAFFISTKILIPIKNLIFIADAMRLTDISLPGQSTTNNSVAFTNNMKYLNSSFVNAVSSINYLNNFLEKLKPDISDILFKDLLTGKPIPKEDIDNYLTNINSSITNEGLYNVMVIKTNQDDTYNLTKNYLSAIENILNIKTKDFCSYHIQIIDNTIYAIIFQFHNSSAHTIKVFERDLKNMLTNTSSYLHVPAVIGTGKIYKSLQDLHFSYSDALNMTTVKSSSNSEDSSEIETYNDKTYYNEHIQKLFQFIENDDEENALLFANQLILKIYNENNSLDEVRVSYISYAEAVLNKLLEFKNISLDANTLFQINTALERAEEKTIMKNTIDSFIKEAVLLAFDHYKKYKHPYIIKASEYIKNHYSDSSLSLSEIAEKLGTNSTYLSKLFKENMGVNFNDFINSYRIDAAKFLLNNTDKKIEQISNETGFNSQQNFIRVFKKIEGVAPGQYRKAKQVDI